MCRVDFRWRCLIIATIIDCDDVIGCFHQGHLNCSLNIILFFILTRFYRFLMFGSVRGGRSLHGLFTVIQFFGLQVKWSVSSRWLFGPNSASGSIETMTTGKTYGTSHTPLVKNLEVGKSFRTLQFHTLQNKTLQLLHFPTS